MFSIHWSKTFWYKYYTGRSLPAKALLPAAPPQVPTNWQAAGSSARYHRSLTFRPFKPGTPPGGETVT